MRTTLGSGKYGIKGKIGYHNDFIQVEWDQGALKSRFRVLDSACSGNADKAFEELDINAKTLYEATAGSWMQCINSTFFKIKFNSANSNHLAFPILAASDGWLHYEHRRATAAVSPL